MAKKSVRVFAGVLGAGLLLLAGLAAGPCVEQRSLENGLASFRVTVVEVQGVAGGEGTLADPYDVPEDDIDLQFVADAIDQHGARLLDYAGEATFRVTPGEIVAPASVTFVAGQASGTVSVRKVFGRTTLWIEDVRWVPGPPAQAGMDSVEQIVPEGTWAAGVSNFLYFKNPSLRQVQYQPQWVLKNDTSALPDRFVEFDCQRDALGPFTDGHGQLLVTGVFNEGFFVTDLADQGLGFNHLYSYSYSYPEDLDEGDRIDRLVGTTQDFSGCTQIGFPAWTRAMDANHDNRPFKVADIDAAVPPAPLTTEMCRDGSKLTDQHLCGYSKDSFAIEALESARVRLDNVHATDLYLDCDFNSDLELPLISTDNPEEYACRDACLKHDGLTPLTVKRVRAKPETLWAISTEGRCDSDTDCASGRCGGWTDADKLDHVCRVTCPWEADIADIRPNCMLLTVKPEFVCSELSTLEQFGQWGVALPADPLADPPEIHGPQISVISRETLVTYDPTAQENLGRSIAILQGNLRQVRAARPRWLVIVGHGPNDVPPEIRD
jgi:hypothetical protein